MKLVYERTNVAIQIGTAFRTSARGWRPIAMNPSDDEFRSREDHSVRNIATRLPINFFNKLRSALEIARDQMTIYSQGADSRKIVYLVINYDDILHEYTAAYSTQLSAFIANNPVLGLNLELDVKPAYYWATEGEIVGSDFSSLLSELTSGSCRTFALPTVPRNHAGGVCDPTSSFADFSSLG